MRYTTVALVSETGPGAANASAISSYSVGTDGTLLPINSSVPTLGTANCWNAVTPDGRFAYTSNAGSSTISGFALSPAGALTPLLGTVVGSRTERHRGKLTPRYRRQGWRRLAARVQAAEWFLAVDALTAIAVWAVATVLLALLSLMKLLADLRIDEDR